MTSGPTLTSISPASGSTAGGTSVTISGTGFTGATAVTFGGTAATFTVKSATQITATTPAHAAGTVNVVVTTPGGTATGTNKYTYVTSGPTLTSISPASGSTAGGTSVTISGTGFTGATAVTFGGTAATFTVKSATQITATTPAHAAGTVNVVVTTPGGTATGTNKYTYVTNLPAQVLIVPNPLNIGRTGYFLAFVKLPTGYKAADVDAGSVYCEGAKALKLVRINVFPQVFVGIFSRQDLGNYPTGTHQMYVWGAVKKNGNYVPFRGSYTVNVINKKVTTKEDVDNVMTMTDTQIFTKFNKL